MQAPTTYKKHYPKRPTYIKQSALSKQAFTVLICRKTGDKLSQYVKE